MANLDGICTKSKTLPELLSILYIYSHASSPNEVTKSPSLKFEVKKMGANESREGSWSIKDVPNGVIVAAAVEGMALLAYGLYGRVSASEQRRKTMKAPGRGDQIIRDDFQANPKAYFRDLRRK